MVEQTPILWRADELVDATGGIWHGTPKDVSDVGIDSRSIGAGELFIAIRGVQQDGHIFAKSAAEQGAVLMLDHMPDDLPDGASVLMVDDTFHALNDLARMARARYEGEVIAITGSVGKTGTKEALKAVFERFGKTHAAVGSFNNHWGVPLTLARMPRDARTAIFEIGMNNPGEIRPLTKLVKPRVVVITTIAAVHMENFSHIEEIARAKAEIFEGLMPGGVAVLPWDNPFFGMLTDHALGNGASSVVGFGEAMDAPVRLITAKPKSDCSCASAEVMGQPVTFKVGLPGHHWLLNGLAVLATAQIVEDDLTQACLTLADLAPPDGRGRRTLVELATGPFLLIDESYNASPISVRAALEVLGSTDQSAGRFRRIAVLGDMLELGAESPTLHARLVDAIVAAKLDHLVTVGPLMKNLQEVLPPQIAGRHCDDAKQAADYVSRMVQAGDMVMVKGSNGMKLRHVVDALIGLDDKPVAKSVATGAGTGNGN